MPIIAKEPEGGGDFAPAPQGTHPARCVGVVDLGTQKAEFQGEVKVARKVRVTWELPEETIPARDGASKPMLVSKKYTLSLHEKAALRHDLSSWRGRDFTDEERAGFDITKLVNATCLLTIVHKTEGQKTFANISGVAKLPKGMPPLPEAHNKLTVYSIEDGKNATFTALPEWLQKQIGECMEWTRPPVEPDADKAPEPTGDGTPEDDGCPF